MERQQRCRVKVVSRADGRSSPHDGRWIVACNPHVNAGDLDVRTTEDRAQACIFTLEEWWNLYRTTSRVQRVRPWDGKPNRPVTGLNYILDPVLKVP